jgi:hypothetical protein
MSEGFYFERSRLSHGTGRGQVRDSHAMSRSVTQTGAPCPHRLRTDCGHRKAMRMPSGKAWGKVHCALTVP